METQFEKPIERLVAQRGSRVCRISHTREGELSGESQSFSKAVSAKSAGTRKATFRSMSAKQHTARLHLENTFLPGESL
jgi:hypothetical protein